MIYFYTFIYIYSKYYGVQKYSILFQQNNVFYIYILYMY